MDEEKQDVTPEPSPGAAEEAQSPPRGGTATETLLSWLSEGDLDNLPDENEAEDEPDEGEEGEPSQDPDDAGETPEETEETEDADDPDAARIPRKRLNEAVAKERAKRDRALSALGYRWDDATGEAVPLEGAEGPDGDESPEPEAGEPATKDAAIADTPEWWDQSVDGMAEDPGWQQVLAWMQKHPTYGSRYRHLSLETMSEEGAALLKGDYSAVLKDHDAKEEQAADAAFRFVETLPDRPELAGADEATVKTVVRDYAAIFRKEAQRRKGSALAMKGYEEAALGLAILKNLDAIVAARSRKAVEGERERRVPARQGQTPRSAPAKAESLPALTDQEKAYAQRYGLSLEEFAQEKRAMEQGD